jgi:hypothetical protein
MAKKYTVTKTNIFYDNQFYAIGDEITLSDSVATKLQDVITPLEEETLTKNKTTKNKTEESKTQKDENGSDVNKDTKANEGNS